MNSITSINVNAKMILPKQQVSAMKKNKTELQDTFNPAFKGYQKTISSNSGKSIMALLAAPFIAMYSFVKLSPKERYIRSIQNKFPNGIENATPQEIFEKIGIECDKDTDGKLIISHYTPVVRPARFDIYERDWTERVSIADLGVDENKLLENVKSIRGNANFIDSNVTRADNLEEVGGDLILSDMYEIDDDEPDYSAVYMKGTGSALPGIGGFYTVWHKSQIESLKNLKSVGGRLDYRNGKNVDMSNLESVGGNMCIFGINNTQLRKLKYIGGSANISDCTNLDLSNLEKIGRCLVCKECNNLNFSNLKNIEYGLYTDRCSDFDVSSLEQISKFLECEYCNNINFDKLKSVGGDTNISKCKNINLNNLAFIDGYFRIRSCENVQTELKCKD